MEIVLLAVILTFAIIALVLFGTAHVLWERYNDVANVVNANVQITHDNFQQMALAINDLKRRVDKIADTYGLDLEPDEEWETEEEEGSEMQ